MVDEVELHVEDRSAVRDGARGQAARADVQRHLPPVVDQRHVRQADLTDDLRPHVQGLSGGRPVLNP